MIQIVVCKKRLFIVFACLVFSLSLMLLPALAAEGEGGGEGLFYYNDLKLSNLPDDVYSSSLITVDGSTISLYSLYNLESFSSWGYKSSSDSVVFPTSFKLWNYNSDTFSWDYVEGGARTIDIPFSLVEWSNFDIYDMSTGLICFVGSDPMLVIEYNSAYLMDETGSLFSSVIGWVGDVAGTIVDNPILLLFCIAVPLCGIGVGFFRRLLSTRG